MTLIACATVTLLERDCDQMPRGALVAGDMVTSTLDRNHDGYALVACMRGHVLLRWTRTDMHKVD
jgi:hypothetical protein